MELILNGNFDSGELGPWSPCGGMALEGGITDMPEYPVFCSSHNLKLLGNDCVRQQLGRAAIASEGNMSVWVRLWPAGPFEYVSAADAGWVEASVEYSAGGDSDSAMVNLDALRARGPAMLDPFKLTVAVDRLQYVTAVRLRCYDASEPWYLAGATMEGYFVGGGDGPFRKAGARMEERLDRIERRMAKLERLVTTALSVELRPSKRAPEPRKPARRKAKSRR
jgi:hypothetical protein